MGLNFSHGGAQWSYTGFRDFRRRLARQIGLDIDMMVRFGGDRSWDEIDDPIKPLLNHSDCDGELAPEECALVAPRLRELVASWPDEEPPWGENYHKVQALRLATGMDLASASGQPLKFL